MYMYIQSRNFNGPKFLFRSLFASRAAHVFRKRSGCAIFGTKYGEKFISIHLDHVTG